jgi:hypothetical protein
MRRLFAAILLIAVLAIGGGAIASTAYQAGLSTAVTTTTAAGGTVVTQPIVVPAYAYGYGYGFHGFGFGAGILGFFGTLLFIFIVFALIRAIVFGGRHRGGPGWGGPGWGPGFDRDARRDHFASKFHGTFEDWHRQAHDASPGSTQTGPGTTGGPTNPPTATPPAG